MLRTFWHQNWWRCSSIELFLLADHTSIPLAFFQVNLISGSALFTKTKNHVRACPLIKLLYIQFIFAKFKQYTYKSDCFKIHFHTYTRVQKQLQKSYMTYLQMFGNAKIWPYHMYNIKSWIFSHKVVLNT